MGGMGGMEKHQREEEDLEGDLQHCRKGGDESLLEVKSSDRYYERKKTRTYYRPHHVITGVMDHLFFSEFLS
jgi:hypothetical protein